MTSNPAQTAIRLDVCSGSNADLPFNYEVRFSPNWQTFMRRRGMSVQCPKKKSPTRLLDHLVRTTEQR
jgi:hypothetical protein